MIFKVHGIQSGRMDRASAMDYLKKFEPESSEIIVFPEKFITGKMNQKDLEDLINCINFDNTVILGSVSFYDKRLFNRSILLNNKKIIGFQDKINLYGMEKKNYSPGSKISLFDVGGLRIGILICYDLDFPELPRYLFMHGCDLIINPSLIRKDFHYEWHIYARARSLENRIPVISINSISDDFMGDSIITVPVEETNGVRLKEYTEEKNDLSVEINTDTYKDARDKRINENYFKP